MSTITQASGARTLEDYQRSVSAKSSSLTQSDFLKILVAQMSNQDPMEPTSNTDFLAQMAQFSMLQSITDLSASFATSQAYGMLGKYVHVQDGNDIVYGRVNGVVNEKGVNYLLVGDTYYDAANVIGVTDPGAVESDIDKQILQGASLIGKTVTGTVTDADNVTTTVSGTVSKLIVQNGAVYAVVNDTNVPIANITEVA